MNSNKILSGLSYLPHKKPKKLIFMLHGYGDTAENFIHVSSMLEQLDLKVNYIALNAPKQIPNYPIGRQWFNLYPNGIYIDKVGVTETKIIKKEISEAVLLIKNTISEKKDFYGLSFNDCFLLGFSQGGMMTYEFGNNFQDCLAGLAIISGCIMFEKLTINKYLLKTPIFISHGSKDEVLPIKLFDEAYEHLKKNKFLFESHILEEDSHIISLKAIKLLQNFIKKKPMM